ncbi:MAG: bifunctional folylpolyglutamate synthase/dihydrofolate synthase, partial [Chitinophagaceae bacterium]
LATLHYNQLHLIFGTVKDKDVTNLLELLPKDASFYFTQAHIPRALAAQNLQALAAALSLIGDIFENVNDAIVAAKKIAKKEDLILVCGSIFLVAEVTKKDFV